ncbi:hypothetical protein B0A48_17455 [Cryoendolithus antarcticus]|uniref:Uncharacterized protein n=1 Tax=Cryoendolithus antarcticus TaxID=1507870 RepID=A0A1V8SDK2_9PEZI|nr:hypothetical protein B0A48_17455 [Cryoendolithus antarcticus]
MSNTTITSTLPESTSSQVSISESSVQASQSSAIASSVSSAAQSSEQQAGSTVIVTNTASSVPPSTQVFTSVVTQTPAAGESSKAPITVVVTQVSSAQITAGPTEASSGTSAAASSTSSTPASLANNGSGGTKESTGLPPAGRTAIAVVVPVVVVALLVIGALFFWRRRKSKKAAEEQRRKEVEDYGFNPNHDPTIPAVASEGPEMTQDSNSGYRGWGAAGLASTRKASTTLSGGHTHGQLSDAGSQPYGSSSPGGPPSDDRSDNALVSKRETMSSDELGALGAGPTVLGVGAAAGAGAVRRGPSNASSHYSNAAHSEHSDDNVPQMPPLSQSYDQYAQPQAYGNYGQAGPYGDGSPVKEGDAEAALLGSSMGGSWNSLQRTLDGHGNEERRGRSPGSGAEGSFSDADHEVANGMRFGIPDLWNNNRSFLSPPMDGQQAGLESINTQSPVSPSSPVSFQDFLSQVPPPPQPHARPDETATQPSASSARHTSVRRLLPRFSAPRSSLDNPFPRPIAPSSPRLPRRVRSTPDRYTDSLLPDQLSSRTSDEEFPFRNQSTGDANVVDDTENDPHRNESRATAVADEEDDPLKQEIDRLVAANASVDEQARAFL